MKLPVISSRNNAEIRNTAKLQQRKYRKQEEAFLVEGTKLVEEALKSGIAVEKIYATEEWLEREADRFDEELEYLTIQPVTGPVLSLLSQMKSPEGVIARIRSSQSAEFDPLANPDSKVSLSYVILEDVQDPGNLGTIIRTADAAGYDLVLISHNCADPYSEKVLRASMGSVFHLPIRYFDDMDHLLDSLKKNGFEIIGSSLEGSLLDLHTVTRQTRIALILGNESRGMTKTAQEACTRLVKIPIYGQAESLNVAVAAGILLYAFIQE